LTPSLVLDVADWAALLCGEHEERLGAAGESAVIPAQYRRRLPVFSRDVVRCALPLLQAAPESAVVLSSPDGDLASTAALLADLAKRELLSPTLFSLSVHNAPAGVLSLCVAVQGDHTAVAAGEASLAAGLTEAYARLASREAPSILLVHGEHRLPAVYADWENDAPGVFLALKLRLAAAPPAPETSIGAGRAGAAALARALAAGARRLRFGAPMAAAA
jgi:Beta-ketoacyl synthase, N-terminal domain